MRGWLQSTGAMVRLTATRMSLLFALLLAACTPNTVTFYRPAVDGGELLRPHCVPTESMIEFDLPEPGGRLRVRAWADNGKQVHQVSLFFMGKGWNELNFTSTQFQIRDIERHQTTDASVVRAYKSDRIEDLTLAPYQAPPERPGLSRFQIQVNSAAPLPEIFDLLSPSIVLDGEVIDFPVIHFELQRWFGISPFNC